MQPIVTNDHCDQEESPGRNGCGSMSLGPCDLSPSPNTTVVWAREMHLGYQPGPGTSGGTIHIARKIPPVRAQVRNVDSPRWSAQFARVGGYRAGLSAAGIAIRCDKGFVLGQLDADGAVHGNRQRMSCAARTKPQRNRCP